MSKNKMWVLILFGTLLILVLLFAVGIAYNEKLIEENMREHMGSAHLSDEEIESVVDSVFYNPELDAQIEAAARKEKAFELAGLRREMLDVFAEFPYINNNMHPDLHVSDYTDAAADYIEQLKTYFDASAIIFDDAMKSIEAKDGTNPYRDEYNDLCQIQTEVNAILSSAAADENISEDEKKQIETLLQPVKDKEDLWRRASTQSP